MATGSAVFLADWWTKTWVLGIHGGVRDLIPGFLRIEVVRNYGILWGFGSNQSWLPLLLQIITPILILPACYLAWRLEPRKATIFAAVLFASGAISNWIDRLRFGYVLDFISLPLVPIINVADLAVFAGITGFAYLSLTSQGQQHASHTF